MAIRICKVLVSFSVLLILMIPGNLTAAGVCQRTLSRLVPTRTGFEKPTMSGAEIAPVLILLSALTLQLGGGGCTPVPAIPSTQRPVEDIPPDELEVAKFTEEYVTWLVQGGFIEYATEYLIQGNDESRPTESQFKALYSYSQFQTDPANKAMTLMLEGGCFSGNNDMFHNAIYTRDLILAYQATGDERLKKAAYFLLKGLSAYHKVTSHPEVMARIVVPYSYESATQEGALRYDYDWKVLGCNQYGGADFHYNHVVDNPYFGGMYFQKSRSVDDFSTYFDAYAAALTLRSGLPEGDYLRAAADEFIGYAQIFSDHVISNKDADAPVCTYPIPDIDYQIDYSDPQYANTVPIVRFEDGAPLVYSPVPYNGPANPLENLQCFVKVPVLPLVYGEAAEGIYYGSLWNLYEAAPSFDMPEGLAKQLPPPTNAMRDLHYLFAAKSLAQAKGDTASDEKFTAAISTSLDWLTDSYRAGLIPPMRYAHHIISAHRLGIPISAEERGATIKIFRETMKRWSLKFENNRIDPRLIKDGQWHSLALEPEIWEDLETAMWAVHMLAPLASCTSNVESNNGIVDCDFLRDLLKSSTP